MFITDKLVIDLIIAVATVIIAAYFYIKHKYSYWTKKGIPQIPPTFPFGNHPISLPKGIGLGSYAVTYYNEFKKQGHKLGGVYMGLDPHLVVTDATYAKNIFSKDFSSFVDRNLFHSENNPLTVNILTQGGEGWRKSRAKFTSIFTSSKMKYYFNTIKKCSDELKTNLEVIAEDGNVDVDIYEVMACYFTDVIGSVIYGVDANSFKSPDAIFRKLGRELFDTFTLPFQLGLFLTICYPKLAHLINIGSFQPDIEKFFKNFVPKTVEHRIKNNIHRADFLELLIEMRKSGIEITNEEMVAQTLIFFSAGYETSSGASSLLLYEVSKNQDIQQKARNEINEVFSKYGGLTYEAVHEMTYLSQIFNETMRKYPLLTTLGRVCVKDYQFPDSNVVIEKGTGIILPVLGWHRDPDLFPDPMKFDPDRFNDKNVKYDGYFPFGDGPRNCIGARLGMLQVKLGLAEVIRNYKIVLSPNVKEELEFDPSTFVTHMTEKVFVRMKKIN